MLQKNTKHIWNGCIIFVDGWIWMLIHCVLSVQNYKDINLDNIYSLSVIFYKVNAQLCFIQ